LFGTRNPCSPRTAKKIPIIVNKMERKEKIDCHFIVVGVLIIKDISGN
jgi:hypothetical protein